MAVEAIEVHVEAGIAQGASLALLGGLAPDEVLDVGVVGVENDHLRCPTGLAPALDRPRRRIGATHEAHRPRCRTPALQTLVGRPQVRQVDAGARTTLEDGSLLDVPVEDGVHPVLDGEDETRARLCRHAPHADVEPDRGVEGGLLVHDEVLELVPEGLRLGPIEEVAVLGAPLGDRVDHAVCHLAQRPLPLGAAQGPPKILLGQDVGRVHAPRGRHLDPELLEGDRPVLEVGDAGVAPLPGQLVVGVHPLGGEVATNADAQALGSDGHGKSLLRRDAV